MALARSLRAMSCSEPLLSSAPLAAANVSVAEQPLFLRSREQATQQLYSNSRYPCFDTFSGHHGTAGFAFLQQARGKQQTSVTALIQAALLHNQPMASCMSRGFLAMLPVTAVASVGDAGTDDASGSAADGVAGRAAGSASGVAGGASGPSAAGEDGDGSRGEVGGVGVVRVSRGSVGCVRHVWTLRALLPAPPV